MEKKYAIFKINSDTGEIKLDQTIKRIGRFYQCKERAEYELEWKADVEELDMYIVLPVFVKNPI